MSTKPTPGPWVVDSAEALNVRAPHGGIVAQLHHLKGRHGMGGRLPNDEAFANARLIASAPELLAACRTVLMLRQLGGMMPGVREVIDVAIRQAEEAIAKATGSD